MDTAGYQYYSKSLKTKEMLGDLLKKMQEAKKEVEAAKKRLEEVYIEEESDDNIIRVVVTGNKRIAEIHIDTDFLARADKSLIEDMTIININKALDKADKIYEEEMKKAAKGLLPGIPGLF